jgi:hypothetical protein
MRKTLLLGLSLYCSVAAAQTPHGFVSPQTSFGIVSSPANRCLSMRWGNPTPGTPTMGALSDHPVERPRSA